MKIWLALGLAGLAAGAAAQGYLPVQPAPSRGPAAAERNLRLWLQRQPEVRRRLAIVEGVAESFSAERAPDDLRDSPGPRPDSRNLPFKIAAAEPPQRRTLLETLPGMRPDPLTSCRSLESCPEASTMIHVEDPRQIEDAVAALARPWILLQHARGRRITVAPAVDERNRIMRLVAEDALVSPLEIYVSPLVQGGYNVWLDGPADPAALYAGLRKDALESQTLPR